MTFLQEAITIALCALGTIITRFLPFIVFRENRPVPRYVQFLGKALPLALFAMLIVYCLKDTEIALNPYGMPELAAVVATGAIHIWWRRMLLSILLGTAYYILMLYIAH